MTIQRFFWFSITTLFFASMNFASAQSVGEPIHAICQSGGGGGGVGTVTSLVEARCGSIASQLRSCVISVNRPKGDFNYVNKKLLEKFGERPFTCKVTIKEDGSLVKVEIEKTSGSEKIDRIATEIVRRAAPFHRSWGEGSGDESYLIDFPLLAVRASK